MRTFQLLSLLLLAVATVSANYWEVRCFWCARNLCDADLMSQLFVQSVQPDNHPNQAHIDNVRSRIHELQTGTLNGRILNQKEGADDRLDRAGDTLGALRDFGDKGNTLSGMKKLIEAVRKRKPEDDEDDGEF